MKIKPDPLLAQIDCPSDLKKLKPSELVEFSRQLRDFIINNVSVNGGHFGASLGVVELTVALHYVFDTPLDSLVWDVGHQAYGHKILTGRRDVFHTNRKYGGLSGFPKRSESPYDAFGVGHSSTSISAALGMAEASWYKGEKNRQHIAVIGDGALTGGIAFEAMNHAGVSNANLIIILNDNCMSIDPNVGALKNYLTDFSTSRTYNKFRDEIWNMLGKFNRVGPNIRDVVSKVENSLKLFISKQSNLFESLNLRYFGPVDGHNTLHLVNVLNDLKNIGGTKLLHCLTVKGKGYQPAEKDQTKWHAPGIFDKITGVINRTEKTDEQPPKYQDVFGHTLVELAKKNEKIFGITPAMPSGSSMKIMMEAIPNRTFDVGIAEQHAVTFSAGLSTQGMIPFCNIYSTFMQRAYDQVIHDVCIQNLHVIFCMDRAGIAGADGPTHHGTYDIAFMRCIPNIVVSAPINEIELRNLMFTASLHNTPFSIRYPRGKGITPHWKQNMTVIPIGKGEKLREGKDIAILSFGHVGNYALKAAKELELESISVAVYDMRFAKPLDHQLLKGVMAQFSYLITVEDGCIIGGFGSAILEFAMDNNYKGSIKRLGIPDRFIEHGEQTVLHRDCGYDVSAIKKNILESLQPKSKTSCPR